MSSNLVSLKSVQNGVSPHWSSCSTSQNLRPCHLTPYYTNFLSMQSWSRLWFNTIYVRSHFISYKSCFLSIRDLRRIRNTFEYTTAQCVLSPHLSYTQNSIRPTATRFFWTFPMQSQQNRLQLILNSSAWAVSKYPKFSHITFLLKSLHWLKIQQHIEYKVISTKQLSLDNLLISISFSNLDVQSNRTTRSFDIIALQRISVRSRLKVA